jgi:hypothetical protein
LREARTATNDADFEGEDARELENQQMMRDG